MAYDNEMVYIVDRCHLTEMVYTFITGRKTNYPMQCIGLVDSLFAQGKTLLLYMGASVETLERRMAETGRETEGDINHIAAAFMTCLNLTKIHDIMILDSDKFDTDELSRQVVAKFKQLSGVEETNDDEEEVDERFANRGSISRRSEIASGSVDEAPKQISSK